jgi:hypothetical protein
MENLLANTDKQGKMKENISQQRKKASYLKL